MTLFADGAEDNKLGLTFRRCAGVRSGSQKRILGAAIISAANGRKSACLPFCDDGGLASCVALKGSCLPLDVRELRAEIGFSSLRAWRIAAHSILILALRHGLLANARTPERQRRVQSSGQRLHGTPHIFLIGLVREALRSQGIGVIASSDRSS